MYPPSEQPTMPNPALQPGRQNQPASKAQSPIPAPPSNKTPPRLAQRPPGKSTKRKGVPRWIWLLPIGFVMMGVFACAGILLVVGMSYGDKVLPGVSVGGVDIGGMTAVQAQHQLNAGWRTLTLRDGDRSWQVNPDTLGIRLDAAASAQNAFEQGRGNGDFMAAMFGSIDTAPIINVDMDTARIEMERIAAQVLVEPRDAGVEFVDGQVRGTDPANGRVLDVQATLTRLQNQGGALIADGELDLIMAEVAPAVSDAGPILAEAQRLLSSPLDIRVFDPVTGDSVYWSLAAADWANWLTAQPDANSPIGLSLSADSDAVREYLTYQSDSVLDDSRFIDVEQGVASIQNALAVGDPSQGYVRVYHRERQHVVQSGESITSIAWDYGIPYLYIQQANNGIEGVSVGQSITIPPADRFLEYDVVPNKRIVVSISQQKTWVYENGQIKWEWLASTGINDSPTWPGVYQILSHEPNAYAGNWDLWMPNFMGVYRPVPGSDFTNGFHGFPTRGGGQLLWENSLGRRVTYGCILLHNDHVRQLYEWAETGVIVEIQA